MGEIKHPKPLDSLLNNTLITVAELLVLKVYTGYSDTKTWFEARDYCRAIGGDLISFHSAAEQQLQQARYNMTLYTY